MFLFAGPQPQLQFAVWANTLQILVCFDHNVDLFSEVRFQCEGYLGPVLALWFKMVPKLSHKELSQDSRGEVRASFLITWPANASVMFTPNTHYYLNREQGVAIHAFNSTTREAEAGRVLWVSRPNWSTQGYVLRPCPNHTLKRKMFIFVYICLYGIYMYVFVCEDTHECHLYPPSCLWQGLTLFVSAAFMPRLSALESLGNSVSLPSPHRSIAVTDAHQPVRFIHVFSGHMFAQRVLSAAEPSP